MRKVALQRIRRLFEMAEEKREWADRYVELAFKIAKKHRVRIPWYLRRRFCRKCLSFWVPGETVLVRLKPKPQPHVMYKCLRCGYVRRVPYLREKKFKPSGEQGNETLS